jgi:hypothetical protein
VATDSVLLRKDQRLELSRIAQSRSLPAGYVFRARLILMLAEGASFSTIKERLGTTAPTISRWKQRFVASGIDGLDTSHPGQSASVLTPKLRAPDSLGFPQTAEGRFHALELPQACRSAGRQQGRCASGVERGWPEAAPPGALHGQQRSGFRSQSG